MITPIHLSTLIKDLAFDDTSSGKIRCERLMSGHSESFQLFGENIPLDTSNYVSCGLRFWLKELSSRQS